MITVDALSRACRPLWLGAMLTPLLASQAWAQKPAAEEPYPNRPVRLIVTFAAGGGGDILARLFAQKLTDRWGQQVLVDNRAGAGGVIGADLAAKSPPNG